MIQGFTCHDAQMPKHTEVRRTSEWSLMVPEKHVQQEHNVHMLRTSMVVKFGAGWEL